ncbi:ABC transporter permease [Catenulispora sp. NF23]|uniref:ABC transporter permease n=1 Tax=Catenulispora pinistramenti TaxID=2705254 RepID=A0ABS5KRG4_9ACTN|nr:ABC transporter permease [Catenulispora pinistramenti]MBS2536059.1 ABC transporter permease [Catenulispora pinistramenti]MBS2548641.1 ABC transporter permease [Catenulispora pinistramenti]
MNAIAIAESRMLLRNRLVSGCAILLPLAFGLLLYASRDTHKPGGAIAGVQTVLMIAMGTYVTATTTLAARRQTLFLKRMRGAAVSDKEIITGLLLPVVAVNIVQIGVVFAILAATDAPADPLLLAVAVILAEAMFTGLALATAGFTNSPEHAQYTTAPVFLVTLAAAVWFQVTSLGGPIAVKRALPGGAVAELVSTAWNGGGLGAVPVLLAASLGWAIAGVLAARACFRWEPRR